MKKDEKIAARRVINFQTAADLKAEAEETIYIPCSSSSLTLTEDQSLTVTEEQSEVWMDEQILKTPPKKEV